MNVSELAGVLVALGCPKDKSDEMAAQLDKRARQLAEQKNRSLNLRFTIYDLRASFVRDADG